MKYLSLLVLFTCLFLQTSFSQVKKQYLDNKNTSTTVVVKEDAANDYDILNSQFDLNSVGMGQVIKIKTEQLQPKGGTAEVPQATVAGAEVPMAEVPLAEVPTDEPKAEVTPIAEVPEVTPKKKIVKKAAKPAPQKVAKPRVKRQPTEKYYKGIGKSKKVKTKRKKIKKRKRFKKRKRRRVLCPSF